MFLGYVGIGMATGAVHGDIFVSPGPAAILAAIRALASPAGNILVSIAYVVTLYDNAVMIAVDICNEIKTQNVLKVKLTRVLVLDLCSRVEARPVQ